MRIERSTMITNCISIQLTPMEAHQLWLALSCSNPTARKINTELIEYMKLMKVSR